ncbi:LCP family protein, partial [Patescibacteria group bacterium]
QTFKGRTNVLILGKGGEGHDAPDLTDTIIFASISHEDGSVSMISLPRDIWVDELKTKLNSLYYWGNQKQEGGGLILAKSHVEEVIGQPLHYGIVIDFEGFVDVIDVIGGVEVNVKNGFTDEKYPIMGKEDDECGGDTEFKCRYKTVKFDKGTQTMDGKTALIFVRSRNADGDEGTDLARAERQELIIASVKDKVLSSQILLSPKKLRSLYEISGNAIETDIDANVGPVLARKIFDARDNFVHFS